MSKTVMTIVIPNESKIRKVQPPVTKQHEDKSKYTRKEKHKESSYVGTTSTHMS